MTDQLKTDQLKPMKIGYGKTQVIFHLRMISVAEEDAINKRFRDLADMDGAEKYQRQYEITRDALAEFSVKPFEFADDNGNPEAIGDFFKEKTARTERIINGAFYLFKSQLEPEASFL